jgi:type 1 fimbria pilin
VKVNKLVVGLGLSVVMMAGFANAADVSTGKINFKGSIVNAACSLKAGSDGQEVDMGQVSATGLVNKKTPVNNFQLELINCDATTLKSVTTTFNGVKAGENAKLLSTVGSARGAGIEIAYAGGAMTLGVASPVYPLIAGMEQATLPFTAQLVATTGVAKDIVPGEFSAVTNFSLSYQ